MTSLASYPLASPPGGNVIGIVPMSLDGGGVPQASQAGKPYNTAANNVGYQIKTGSGTFWGLSVNTAGVTSTATLYDGTSTAGSKLGTFTTTAQGGPAIPMCGIGFATGLFIVLAGGTAADITIVYQ